jgi:hypothetical protein
MASLCGTCNAEALTRAAGPNSPFGGKGSDGRKTDPRQYPACGAVGDARVCARDRPKDLHGRRGNCKNTDGLLRQYLPKGTDLSVYTQTDLDVIADSLNNRPRATHTFRFPLEVFVAAPKAARQPSISIC